MSNEKQRTADLPFEDALDQLETIVKKLEAGELNLEDSLGAFERGVELAKLCHTRLDEAEKKVEQLLANGVRKELDG